MIEFLAALGFIAVFWLLGMGGALIRMAITKDYFWWGMQLIIGFAVGNLLAQVTNIVFKFTGVWDAIS